MHLLRVAITGDDDLSLTFEKRVERVEELFLRAILPREELDVIDEQRVQRAIRLLKLADPIMLKRIHHVSDEALRVHVGDAGAGVLCTDHIADAVHQVCLAETHTTIYKQG